MFWRKNNKIVTNSSGNLLRCSACPCKIQQGINMYLDMWNTFQYTSYTDNFTWDLYYYRYFPYSTRNYYVYNNSYEWVDTESFMTDSKNGSQSLNTFGWQGYNIDKNGNQSNRGSSSERHYWYKAWEHDQNYWYFNFSIHSGLGYFEDEGRLFYGNQPIVADYSIWTVAMSETIDTAGGTIYRTNSIKNPSFAYRFDDFWRQTDWSLVDFQLKQSFIPFQLDVAPYGVQTMQYSYKFNIWTTGGDEVWKSAVHQGYCKWTVEVNLTGQDR